MAKHTEYEERAEALLRPIAENFGVEIYDVEYVKEGFDFYLRAYIDKDGGVNIGDCENVSRALSDALDREDFIPDAYILEVSSPGLGRRLTKDRHLDRSIGSEVELKFYKPPDKDTPKTLSGVLTGYDKDSVSIDTDGEVRQFERKTIADIRLALDF